MDLIATQAKVGHRRDIGFCNIPRHLPTMPMNLAPRLRGVVFVGKAALCARADC